MVKSNKVYTQFSTTTARGYLQGVRKHGDHYFANLSLACGTKTKESDSDKVEPKYQNISCIVGSSLHYFCDRIISGDAQLEKLSLEFEIHNLYFEVSDETDANGKNYLNGNGSLQSITI